MLLIIMMIILIIQVNFYKKNYKRLNMKDTIKKIKKFVKDVTSSKEKAESFLKSTGIYTKKGNLRKIYK